MDRIEPYPSASEAIASLDNGGRLFNLMTKQGDDQITLPELSKAAGVFNQKQQAIVFLAMSTAGLDHASQQKVLASLDTRAKAAYEKYSPTHLSPADAERKGVIDESAIVTGVPSHVRSNTDFKGFIMVPVMAGSTMTMVMIPIMDKYDVYEIRDELSSEKFFIAHTRGGEKLPEQRVRVGGVIKQIKLDKKEGGREVKFLEAFYYTTLTN